MLLWRPRMTSGDFFRASLVAIALFACGGLTGNSPINPGCLGSPGASCDSYPDGDGGWQDATQAAANEGGIFDGGADSSDTGDAADAAASGETSGDAELTDGGALACGDAFCDASQICLYPAYGCIALAMPDSGVCPDGTAPTGSYGCLPPPPPPSCVSPNSVEGFFDCSGEDAAAHCDNAQAPIPSDCSRVCRGICV